jgi:pantetheine-phosphate adenylyltransferase
MQVGYNHPVAEIDRAHNPKFEINAMRLALLSGSMNPFTLGHQHLVDMSLLIFERLVVAIGSNPEKSASTPFTLDERLDLIRASVSGYGDRVSVQTYEGATVDFALYINAIAMVRGIRNGTDHAHEASINFANSLMTEEGGRLVPTLYFQCPPALMEVSSTRVRELMMLGRSDNVLSHYVPSPVLDAIRSKRG